MYNPTATTTSGPFLHAFSPGLAPLTQEIGREFNIAQGSTSQGQGSPLGVAAGDLEAGPPGQPSFEQLWEAVTAIQHQVTQSQLQLATLLAARSAPPGAPPGVQAMPVQPVTGAPPGGGWQQQPVPNGPPGRRWPTQEPRNLQG